MEVSIETFSIISSLFVYPYLVSSHAVFAAKSIDAF